MDENGNWNITIAVSREQAGVISSALHWLKQDHLKIGTKNYENATLIENTISELVSREIGLSNKETCPMCGK